MSHELDTPQGRAAGRRAERILVVEDSTTLRTGIVAGLREAFATVDEQASGGGALERISDRSVEGYHLVVTDLRLPGADGVEVLKAAIARDPRTAVLLMTAYGSIESAVEAMRLGAVDFIEKPFDLEQLEYRVDRALAQRSARGPSVPGPPIASGSPPDSIAEGLVVESAAMAAAVELAGRVAPTPSTVLLSGETGTGKELVAGLIHRLSPRASRPYVKVNCAALPETLLEAELFGHERGAFTGAARQRPGRFEEASGGTLFLDEVGDMSPATQAKLLRVLQDQEFYRVGGTQALRTDARIVAATNLDLKRATRDGRFREDLYFRLNVVEIHLPPLRERPEDAVALAERFLAEFSQAMGRSHPGLSEQARERIRGYPWPGNVRELRNVIERSVLMSDGGVLQAGALAIGAAAAEQASGTWDFDLPEEGVDLRVVERDLVLAALERTGFVQKEAARLLRVTPRKLNYMIARHGVTHPSWRRNSPSEAPEGSPCSSPGTGSEVGESDVPADVSCDGSSGTGSKTEMRGGSQGS